jgi:transposase
MYSIGKTIYFVRICICLNSPYPLIHKSYQLSLWLGEVYRLCKCKEEAFKKMTLWYSDVEEAGMLFFKTVARTIKIHYLGILNIFNSGASNAAAESFNAKIKSFRNALRGVREVEFFSL